jgi:probable phosphoglycerate mutase
LTRIYLIRHAEAEGNLYRRAHGQYDGLLTKNGLAQTERLSEWFSRRPVDAVYSSDLRRAVRTAEAVASVCRKPVVTVPGLREVCLGEWEDRTWGEISRKNTNYRDFFDKKALWKIPGGETVEEAGGRVFTALSGIASSHKDKYIAVVSHGCVTKDVLERITGKSLPHLDNASVSFVEWESGNTPFIGENKFLGDLSTFSKQSWWKNDREKYPDTELWFRPVLLPGEFSAAFDFCKNTWETIYGTMGGFREEMSEKSLYESAETNPRFLQFAMEGDKIIGLIQMRDAGRLSAFDGHISLFCLIPEKRGLGYGAQLLGEAVSLSRQSGKTGLSLRVFHQNLQALSFYRKMGFVVCGSEEGYFGALIQMRMDL